MASLMPCGMLMASLGQLSISAVLAAIDGDLHKKQQR